MVKLKDGREADLELFKFDSCPYCVLVMDKMKELGVDGVRLRDTWREEGAEEELIRRGGKRQVPCMFIDGQPMYESKKIAGWLEEHVARG